MRELVQSFLRKELSRRAFAERVVGLGFTAAAARTFLSELDAAEPPVAGAPGSTVVKGTGGETVVAQMQAAGVEYLFTNPGSFEVGLFDAFLDKPDMQLIMGLHEGVVISTADGYHRVSGKPAFVNVHVIAGTAQAAGQMYNAARDGSHLIVTAGLNDNEMWSDEAGLAPRPGYDQKEINRQFTKISWEAREPQSLALMLRRAFKSAAAPPGGPVYLAMAHHALEAQDVESYVLPGERFLWNARPRPARDGIEKAARLLAEARNPLVVVGDEVWKSGAQDELLTLSEKLGIPVSSQVQGFQNFPSHHPHNVGRFRMGSELVKRGIDTLLVVGAFDFGGRTIPTSPEAPLDATFIRLGLNTSHMGRNYPTDLALVGDVREGLRDLNAAVDSLLTSERRRSIAAPRSQKISQMTTAMRDRAESAAKKNVGQAPVHPDEVGAAIARNIDSNAIVVAENLTGKHAALRLGHREDEAMWVGNTGNGLGWGVGAASGAKLAAPDRQVVCSIGDGSVMYSASGFWTQARYEIPVLTVVWNNRNYQTVRRAYYGYKRKMAEADRYTGMYLGDPDIDFAALAKSQGVDGERVASPDRLDAAFERGRRATREGQPYLIDVETARYGGGAESTWHQKYSLADQRKKKV